MRKTTNDKLKSRQKSTFKPLKACVWTAFTNYYRVQNIAQMTMYYA